MLNPTGRAAVATQFKPSAASLLSTPSVGFNSHCDCNTSIKAAVNQYDQIIAVFKTIFLLSSHNASQEGALDTLGSS